MSNQAIKKTVLTLMAGLPGVGKTTLARYLEGALLWNVIDKDTIKDVLLENAHLSEEQAGRAAFDIAFGLLKDSLASGHSAILDSSALHPFIVEGAIRLCNELRQSPGIHVQLKVVLCEVDNKTRLQRLHTRKQRSSQQQSNSLHLEDYQLFEHLPADRLTLHTEDSLETYADRAANYLMAMNPSHLSRPNIPPTTHFLASSVF